MIIESLYDYGNKDLEISIKLKKRESENVFKNENTLNKSDSLTHSCVSDFFEKVHSLP